jgi:hypothetical protein
MPVVVVVTTPVVVVVTTPVVLVVLVVVNVPPSGEKMLKFEPSLLLNAARMFPLVNVAGNAAANVLEKFHVSVEPFTIGPNPPAVPPPIHWPHIASEAPPLH